MSSRCMSTKQNPTALLVSSYPQVCVQPFCKSHQKLTGARLTEAERYRILGARLIIKSSGKSICINATISPRLPAPRVLIPTRIFWVVSVPIAFILMVFFFTSWPKKIQGRWKAYQQRDEETPVPAYMPRPTPVNPSGSVLKRLKGRRNPKALDV